jgi:hypothetical protein
MGVNTRMLPLNGSGGTLTGWAGPNEPPQGASTRRYYSASGGGFIDATGPPDADAATLSSQGFLIVCVSGTTTLRNQLSPGGYFKAGQLFLDITLGLVICWDGLAWRNPVNGNAV